MTLLPMLLAFVWLALPGLVAAQPPAAARTSTCESCHGGLEGEPAAPAALFKDDVHKQRGFTCVDCHGGNPATDDPVDAKSPAAGFRGVPSGRDIIRTCARCHSDPALMRRFDPRERVDQESEYWTSVHGQQLAGGDAKVATCISCHGAHGIRAVSNARSPVFPLNVAATCARCHDDPAYMKGYTTPDGTALSTSQHAEYKQSVHYRALTERNDLSAPTCNDCHGNHGAAPPGVGAIVNVCGTCHGVFAERFALSSHREIFEKGCLECHENHAVADTSDDLVGTTAPALCVECHSDGDNGFATAGAMRARLETLKNSIGTAETLVARVKNAGMDMADQEFALAEARTRLTLARTEVHTADLARVEPVVNEGLVIVQRIDEAGQRGLAELQYRRRGLLASLAAILIVVIALGLKLRQIERQAH